MRAWRDPEPPRARGTERGAAGGTAGGSAGPAAGDGRRGADDDGDGPGGNPDGRQRSAMEELARLRAASVRGADPATHHHGDVVHAHLEPHPHQRGTATAPTVGIVGAGSVGTALGVAIHRAGWPVPAFATRDPGRSERFQRLVPGTRAFIEPSAILDEVELVILAVPDDAIREVVDSLRLYSGQALVHTSGLLGADVLAPALAAGSQIGAFHPLVSFTSDIDQSVEAIRGATIAVEGDERLLGLLADLAEAIGGVPVRLPRGSKPAYHAAAVLASGGLVALLDTVVTVGKAVGLDERGALNVYGRLAEQTLANARRQGVTEALTGPIVRGDTGTLEAHIAALESLAPDVVELYLAAARRELAVAQRRGVLSPDVADRVAAVLAKGR